MTVDELLEYLRDEWQKAEDSFSEAYKILGIAVYNNRERVPGGYPTPNCYEVAQIDSLSNRQSEITTLIGQIKREQGAAMMKAIDKYKAESK